MSRDKKSVGSRLQVISGTSQERAPTAADAAHQAHLRVIGAQGLLEFVTERDAGDLSPDASTGLLCLLLDARRLIQLSVATAALDQRASGKAAENIAGAAAGRRMPFTALECDAIVTPLEGAICIAERASRDEEHGLSVAEVAVLLRLLSEPLQVLGALPDVAEAA